jgi:sulfotransferase family protein
MPNMLNLLNRCGRSIISVASSDPDQLILLGPPRSNSTLIHRLLAHHSEVISPPLRELVFPGALGTPMRRALSLIPQARIDSMYNPAIHATGPHMPEADDIALLAAFSEGVFAWAYGGALTGDSAPTLDSERHLKYLAWHRRYIAAKHPGRVVCSKYFAGVHHYDALRARHPNAKLVLLVRDPKAVCYSLSTLIGQALQVRGLVPARPADYWRWLYAFVARTFDRIVSLIQRNEKALLVVWDDDVKLDLQGTVERICEHAGIPRSRTDVLDYELRRKRAAGPYRRRYEYSRVLDGIFSPDDFTEYYGLAANASSHKQASPD